MLEVLQVWGDKISLYQISYEQHFYLTQALIICMTFIIIYHYLADVRGPPGVG